MTRAAHCGERSSFGKGCLEPHLQYTCKELCYSSTTCPLPVQPAPKLLLLHLHPCLWWVNSLQQLPPASHPSPERINYGQGRVNKLSSPRLSFNPGHSPRAIFHFIYLWGLKNAVEFQAEKRGGNPVHPLTRSQWLKQRECRQWIQTSMHVPSGVLHFYALLCMWMEKAMKVFN